MQFTNAIFNNGTFVSANPPEASFQRLADQVATGAFHDSGELSGEGTCHPGTRISILEELKEWASLCPYPFPIKWLHGPAGAGKSTIARTLAQCPSLQNLLIAAFFFFRAGNRRNNAQHFFATIAYQLCRTIPATRPHILAAIEEDPLVFSRSLAAQAQSLIINPLTRVQLSSDHPRIIIIDGLDECDDADRQCEILKVMNNILHQLPFPIALLVVSRPEFHIRNAFDIGMLNRASSRMSLDNSFKPDEDIERYYLDRFRDILEHHPLRSYIDTSDADPWPGRRIVTSLVQKASGQFIFASTAILFIKSPRHRPHDRLKIIIGSNPPGNLKPFQQLDILYSTILATVEDFPNVYRVLGMRLVPYTSDKCYTPEYLAWFLGLHSAEEIRCLLIDLGSLLNFKGDDNSIQVFHASLADFLFDKLRSGQFYIDQGAIYEELARRSMLLAMDQGKNGTFLRLNMVDHMSEWFKCAHCSLELSQAIGNCDMTRLAQFCVEVPDKPRPLNVGLRVLCPMFLNAIKVFVGAAGIYLEKYSEYEVHLRKTIGVYLKSDQLTCALALVCLDNKFGKVDGEYLSSFIQLPEDRDREAEDTGLGLLRYRAPPLGMRLKNLFRGRTSGTSGSNIHDQRNCHSDASLKFIRDLLDKLHYMDRLYADAATYLIRRLSTSTDGNMEVWYWASSLIQRSGVQADLAKLLLDHLGALEKYGHDNLLKSIIVYLLKYRDICRRRIMPRTSSTETCLQGAPSVVNHPPIPAAQTTSTSISIPTTCSLGIKVDMQDYPTEVPKTSTSWRKTERTLSRTSSDQAISNSRITSVVPRGGHHPTGLLNPPPPPPPGTSVTTAMPRSTTGVVARQIAKSKYSPASAPTTPRGSPIPRLSSPDLRRVSKSPSRKSTKTATPSRDPHSISQKSRSSSASPSGLIRKPISKAPRLTPFITGAPGLGVQDTKIKASAPVASVARLKSQQSARPGKPESHTEIHPSKPVPEESTRTPTIAPDDLGSSAKSSMIPPGEVLRDGRGSMARGETTRPT